MWIKMNKDATEQQKAKGLQAMIAFMTKDNEYLSRCLAVADERGYNKEAIKKNIAEQAAEIAVLKASLR